MTTHVVIGSNSFTGSHVVDALLQDPANQAIGISRSPEYSDLFLPYKQRTPGRFRFCQMDMVHQFQQVAQLLDQVRPQVVINVAALSEVALSNHQPVEYFAINTEAVVRLCHHLRQSSYLERYVHISSAEILGPCDRPAREDAPFRPSSPYAVSKASADMYINTLISNFGFPATIVRSTNVYGKHQQLFKIIPRTAIYLKLGKTIELHGGGGAIRAFVHIRDVVRGMLLAIERHCTGTYNFSVAGEETIADVVRQVCTMAGHDFESSVQVVGERLGQDARYWLDCSKAREELGWEPQVDFVGGVAEVVQWIDANWDEVLRHPLEYRHKV